MDRDKYSKPLSKEELGVNEGKQVMGRGLLIHQEWHRVMANRYRHFLCHSRHNLLTFLIVGTCEKKSSSILSVNSLPTSSVRISLASIEDGRT